jgi:thioredoxin 1
MNKTARIVIVAGLIVAVAAVVNLRPHRTAGQSVPDEYRPEHLTGKGLPVLIDLGADSCIPCKLMAPVLSGLKEDLAGKLDVHFLNTNEYPGLADVYRIRVIPVQIFYDAAGKELFRHEGFFAREDILAKWKELGVDLADAGSQSK